LSDISAIQYASFGNGVHVDITTSNTGIVYPVGTGEYPVNNLTDAVAIAVANGFKILFIESNLVVSSSFVLSNYTVVGHDAHNTSINFQFGCQTTGSIFRNFTATGSFSGAGS